MLAPTPKLSLPILIFLCESAHKNALFCRKYLKNFLGMGHSPLPRPHSCWGELYTCSPDPNPRPLVTYSTSTPCRLRLLVLAPRWLNLTRSVWKMLGPFTTASRLTPIQQMLLAVLSRAACASMSTTTTTRDRGPLWPHGMGPIKPPYSKKSFLRPCLRTPLVTALHWFSGQSHIELPAAF